METISQERAREIVDVIRMNLGGISAAERAKADPAVLSALDSVRRQLGAATQMYCPPRVTLPSGYLPFFCQRRYQLIFRESAFRIRARSER